MNNSFLDPELVELVGSFGMLLTLPCAVLCMVVGRRMYSNGDHALGKFYIGFAIVVVALFLPVIILDRSN